MSSQHPMMTRDVRTHQRGVRLMYATIDGSAVAGGTLTTNGLDALGKLHMKVTENAAGDYTLTLNVPGARICHVSAISIDNAEYISCSIPSASTARVKQYNAAGALVADHDIQVCIHVSTAADAS